MKIYTVVADVVMTILGPAKSAINGVVMTLFMI